jgi:hypothetical protein
MIPMTMRRRPVKAHSDKSVLSFFLEVMFRPAGRNMTSKG